MRLRFRLSLRRLRTLITRVRLDFPLCDLSHSPVHDPEQLGQSLLPSAVSSGRRLNGKCVLGSIVSNDGDTSETETESSSEFKNGREAANLDKVVVAINMLLNRESV